MESTTKARKSSWLLLVGKLLLHAVLFVLIARTGGKVGALFCGQASGSESNGAYTVCGGELFSASLLCGLLSLVYLGWVLKNPVTRFFTLVFPRASSWRVLLPRALGFVFLLPGVWFAFYMLTALSVTLSCSTQLNDPSAGLEGCGTAGFVFGIWAGFIGAAIYMMAGIVIFISRLLESERA